MRGRLAIVLAVAACGGNGDPARPDAGPSADAAPADAPTYAACREFGSAAVQVPAHVISTLGDADVESPAQCAAIDAPFGVESAGPDRVIPLRNLSPGMPYVVRVASTADLAFYVVTGCGTPTGPAADQCVLFQDGSTAGREVGRFVADSATAFVVVDFYASQPPASLDFTLDVYPEQCQASSAATQCGGPTPACFEGQCVGCVTSFDCSQSSLSVCGGAQVCTSGIDTCTSDAATEPDDDGPAGAIPIVPDAQGMAVVSSQICSSPRTEADFFAFEVTTLGETWTLQLGWTGGRDLDLRVYDATGAELGMSFWEQPERIRLTYLPPGRYYAKVREFVSTADPSPVSYTLTAQRALGAACTSAADCALEYRNQVFRGRCFAGSCVAIDGNGAVPEGGACDSMSDCGTGLACPSFFFVSDADTRDTCARGCLNDTDCAPLGTGFVCTTYLTSNFCVPKCTEDDHCPTAISTAPAVGPWARLRCDVPSGRCEP